MNRSFQIAVDVYSSYVFCVFGTREYLYKVLREHGIKKTAAKESCECPDADAYVLEFDENEVKGKDSGGRIALYMLEIPKDSYSISVLVHECMHLTAKILLPRRIELDSDGSEEAYAYLIEYLVRTILDKANEPSMLEQMKEGKEIKWELLKNI